MEQQTTTATTTSPVDISQLTEEQKAALLQQLNADAKDARLGKRDAYEGLRAEFMHRVEENLITVLSDTKSFKQWLMREVEAFISIMRQYGQLKNDDQRNYTIIDGDFRLQVSCNKVKGFDERANLAAERLVEYLKGYMQKSDKGKDDPMYQLAMTLLERNQAGDFDYKSISKLYEIEDKFHDPEYTEIMELFKESNVVQKNATNYYFFKRDAQTGVWRRMEPSFCRIAIRSEERGAKSEDPDGEGKESPDHEGDHE